MSRDQSLFDPGGGLRVFEKLANVSRQARKLQPGPKNERSKILRGDHAHLIARANQARPQRDIWLDSPVGVIANDHDPHENPPATDQKLTRRNCTVRFSSNQLDLRCHAVPTPFAPGRPRHTDWWSAIKIQLDRVFGLEVDRHQRGLIQAGQATLLELKESPDQGP